MDDERIVRMKFDNGQFQHGVKDTIKSLEDLRASLNFNSVVTGLDAVQKSINKVSFDGFQNGIDSINNKLDYFSSATIRKVQQVKDNILNAAINWGKMITGAEDIQGGWNKVGENTMNIATMMTATGKSFEEVSDAMEDLLWFSDQTSYSYTDMANSMSKFSASGIKDLGKLENIVKGISLWAAETGNNASTAARVTYQLSQAAGRGYIMNQDWMSVNTANMSSAKIQQELIAAGGEAAQEAIEKYGSFTDSLRAQWLTMDVFSDVMSKYTKGINNLNWSEEEYAFINREGTEATTEFSEAAFLAAQECKTFSDVISAVHDAISTGWMRSFHIVLGDAIEIKQVWTDLCEYLLNIASEFTEARNEMLTGWRDLGGREIMFEALSALSENIGGYIRPIRTAIHEVFGYFDTERAMKITNFFKRFVDSIKLSDNNAQKLHDAVWNISRSLYSLINFGTTLLGTVIVPIKRELSGLIRIILDILSHMKPIQLNANRLIDTVKGNKYFQRLINNLQNIRAQLSKFSSNFKRFKDDINQLASFNKLKTQVKQFGGFVRTQFERVLDSFLSLLSKVTGKDFSALSFSNYHSFVARIDIICTALTKFNDFIASTYENVKNRNWDELNIWVKIIGAPGYGIYAMIKAVGDFWTAWYIKARSDGAGGVNIFVKALKSIPAFLMTIVDYIVKAFSGGALTLRSDFLNNNPLTFLKNEAASLPDVFSKVAVGMQSLKQKIGGFNIGRITFGGVATALEGFKNTLANSFMFIGNFFKKTDSASDTVATNIQNDGRRIGEGFKNLFSGLTSAIDSFLGDEKVKKALIEGNAFGSWAVTLMILLDISHGLSEFGEGLGAFFKGGKSMADAVADSLLTLSGATKPIEETKTDKILMFAIALTAIATAIVVLAKVAMKEGGGEGVGMAVVALASILTGLVVAVNLLGGIKTQTKTITKEFKNLGDVWKKWKEGGWRNVIFNKTIGVNITENLNSFGAQFIMIGVSLSALMLTMAKVAVMLKSNGITFGDMMAAAGYMTAVVIILSTVVMGMSYWVTKLTNPKNKNEGLNQSEVAADAKRVHALSSAIHSIGVVFLTLGASIYLVMETVTKAAVKIKDNPSGMKMAFGMIFLVMAEMLFGLYGILKVMQSPEGKTITAKSISSIGTTMMMLSLSMHIVINAIAKLMLIMGTVITIFTAVDHQNGLDRAINLMVNAFAAVVTIFALMAGFIIVVGKSLNNKTISAKTLLGIGATMLMISMSLTIIIAAFAELAVVLQGAMAVGGNTLLDEVKNYMWWIVTILGGVMVGLVMLANICKDSATVLKLAAVILSVTVLVTAVSGMFITLALALAVIAAIPSELIDKAQNAIVEILGFFVTVISILTIIAAATGGVGAAAIIAIAGVIMAIAVSFVALGAGMLLAAKSSMLFLVLGTSIAGAVKDSLTAMGAVIRGLMGETALLVGYAGAFLILAVAAAATAVAFVGLSLSLATIAIGILAIDTAMYAFMPLMNSLLRGIQTFLYAIGKNEIADRMGQSLNTLENSYQRSRKSLKEASDGVKNTIVNGATAIGNAAETAGETAANKLSSASSGIQNTMAALQNESSSKVSSASSVFSDSIDGSTSNILSTITGNSNLMSTALQSSGVDISNMSTDMFNSMGSAYALGNNNYISTIQASSAEANAAKQAADDSALLQAQKSKEMQQAALGTAAEAKSEGADAGSNYAGGWLESVGKFFGSATGMNEMTENMSPGKKLLATVAGAAGNIGAAFSGKLSSAEIKQQVNAASTVMVDTAAEAAENQTERFGEAGEEKSRAFGAGLVEEKDDAVNAGNGVREAAQDALANAGDSSYQSGRHLGQGFVKGLEDSKIEAYDAASGFASGVTTSANKQFGIASPSKVWRRMAEFCVAGYSLAMSNDKTAAQSAALMANNVMSSFNSTMDANGGFGSSLTPVLDMSNVNASIGEAADMWTNTRTGFAVDAANNISQNFIPQTNSDVVDAVEHLRMEFNTLRNILEQQDIVLDSGALVGQLSPAMDRSLGRRVSRLNRGGY